MQPSLKLKHVHLSVLLLQRQLDEICHLPNIKQTCLRSVYTYRQLRKEAPIEKARCKNISHIPTVFHSTHPHANTVLLKSQSCFPHHAVLFSVFHLPSSSPLTMPKIKGSCLCGAVTYTMSHVPKILDTFWEHSKDSKTHSASAFSMSPLHIHSGYALFPLITEFRQASSQLSPKTAS